jgi:hypothetical protein
MHTLNYRNFKFKGFHSVGACFVRVRVNDDGTVVALIAQLRDYNGTSVTNVIEDIITSVIQHLHAEKYLRKLPSSYTWVERYVPGTSMSETGSWAIVSIDSDGRPEWEHVSLEAAISRCGVEPAFLSLSDEDLQYEK